MASKKISELTTVAPAAGDLLPVVDVSDTTQGPAGRSKRTTVGDVLALASVSDVTALGALTDASADAAFVLAGNAAGTNARKVTLGSVARSFLGATTQAAARTAIDAEQAGTATAAIAAHLAAVNPHAQYPLLASANTFAAGPQVFVGGATVRQAGGTPGTHEGLHAHGGSTDGYDIRSLSGPLWLRAGQADGNVLFSRASDGTAANSAVVAVRGGIPELRLRADVPVTWSASSADTLGTGDTQFTRSSAGFVGIGTATNKVVVGRDGTTYGTVRAEDTVLTLGTSVAGSLGDYLQIAQNSTWSFKQSGSVRATLLNAAFCLNNSGSYGWAAGTPNGVNQDTALARNTAGVVEVNNGTAVASGGSYGGLRAAEVYSHAPNGFVGNQSNIGFQLCKTGLGFTSGSYLSWAPNSSYPSLGDVFNLRDTEVNRNAAGFVGLGSPSNKVVAGHNGTNGLVESLTGTLVLKSGSVSMTVGQGGYATNIPTLLSDNITQASFGRWQLNGSGNGQFLLGQTSLIWAAGAGWNATADTEINRNAAGFVGIGTPTNKVKVGHNNTYGSVETTSGRLVLAPYTGELWFVGAGSAGMRNSAELGLADNASLNWTNATNNFYSATIDTSIRRSAAGVLTIDNGTPGQYRDVLARKATFHHAAYNNTEGISLRRGSDNSSIYNVYLNSATEATVDGFAGLNYGTGTVRYGGAAQFSGTLGRSGAASTLSFGIGNTFATFLSGGTTVVPVVIKGTASQTGNLTELQNNGGTVLAGFSAAGRLLFNAADTAPADTATPAQWLTCTVNGVQYRLPLYL